MSILKTHTFPLTPVVTIPYHVYRRIEFLFWQVVFVSHPVISYWITNMLRKRNLIFCFYIFKLNFQTCLLFKYHILDAQKSLHSLLLFYAHMVLNIFIEAGVQNCSDVNKWRIGQKKFELTILAYGEKTSKGKIQLNYILRSNNKYPKRPGNQNNQIIWLLKS